MGRSTMVKRGDFALEATGAGLESAIAETCWWDKEKIDTVLDKDIKVA